MTVPTTITRKCTAESVQLHLPETTSFASLQQIIETTFAYPVSNKLTKYSITYQDDEGDCIRVETEPETREAFRFGASNGSLAIVVLEDNKPTCCSSSSPALPQELPQEQQAQEQEQQQEEEQKSISTNDSSSNDGKVHVVVDLPTGGEYSCYVDADQPLDELKHIIMQQAGINMPSGVFELVRQEELTSKPTHNAMCDVCGSTIVGIRYKCLNCEDYDLCETCEESNFAQRHHTPSHAFAKLRRPIRWGYRHVCPNFYAQEPANTTTETNTNTTTTTTTGAADVDPLDRIEKDLVALRDQLNAEKAKREQRERDERQRKAEEQRKLMEAQQAKRREANRARQLRKQQQRQAREAERQQREAERKVREEVRKAEQEARKAEQEAIAEAVRKSAEEAKAKAEAEAKANAEAEAKAQAEAEAKAQAEAEAKAKAEAEAKAQAEAEAKAQAEAEEEQARLAAEQEFITPVDSLSLSEYGSFCFVTPDAPTSTPVVEEPVDEPQEQEQEQEAEQPQEQEQQETNVDGYADDETYMADSATFQYVEESMKQLEQMGFENYEQNLTLVIKHKGDMLKIISDLVN